MAPVTDEHGSAAPPPGRGRWRWSAAEPALMVLLGVLLAVGAAGAAALKAASSQASRAATAAKLAQAYDDVELHVLRAEVARHAQLAGDPQGDALDAEVDAAAADLRRLDAVDRQEHLDAVRAPFEVYRALASAAGQDVRADAAADRLLEEVRAESDQHSGEAEKAAEGLLRRVQWLQTGLIVLLLGSSVVAGLATRALLGRAEALEQFAVERARESRYDWLTGLPNRLLITERVDAAIADAERSRRHLAVLWIDLDGFKAINDALGHETGDEVLRQAAAQLTSAVRPTDVVARFGGDEFVVLCNDVPSPQVAERVAARLNAAARHPLQIAGGQHVVTASIGVAHGPMADAESMLAAADAAMYRAKAAGRSRYVVFDESMRSDDIARLQLTSELDEATAHGQWRLYYQPIVELGSGAAVAVEALLRWQHPERGLLAPAAFLDLAETTGQMVTIGAWVIDEACRTAATWTQEAGPAPKMSINLAADQLVDHDIVQTFTEALARHGVDPALLCVEVTESALMSDLDHAIRSLENLRSLGLQVSIDDFGTGYSSLSYLKRFPAHQIKLDRSFVQGVGSDPRDSSIVSAVVSLCRAVDLTLIVEGVETERQRSLLSALGCTLGQGYLWARPMPQEHVRDWLHQNAHSHGPGAAGSVRLLHARRP